MVLNWTDLMESSDEGLLHMEYHTGPERSIQYLKVWSSASRGYWKLFVNTGPQTIGGRMPSG
jgi:hypothetical protein